MTEETVTRTRRPGWVRAVAALMGWVPGARLERGAIIDAARRRTGLQDLGGEDFLEPLELLLEGVRSGRLDTLGRMAAFDAFSHAVENRLHLEAAHQCQPSLAETPIERPIVIVGLARSGTTLLHNLMALAPGLWAPPFWMLSTPVPLDRATRRRARAVRMLRASRLVMPELKVVHPLSADSPEECWSLFQNTFCMLSYHLHFKVPAYGRWLLAHDMTGPYRHYRRQLQTLLAQGPKGARLVLKCPEHLWFLDALRTVFDDSSLIWTHRDPVRTVGSYSSLSALNRRTIYGRVVLDEIGAHLADAMALGARRAMAVRDRVGDAPFVDVHYAELSRDPIGVGGQVFERLGLDRSALTAWEPRARAWLAADKRDRHVYSSRQFGLSANGVRARFRDYLDRFAVALEPDV